MKNQSLLVRIGYALNGIKHAARSESNFKIHLCATAFIFSVLLVAAAPPIWWAAIVLTVGCVFASELFNTALEHVLDHLHPGRHEAVRIAKDCAAGAVLLCSLASIGVFIAFLFSLY